VPAAATAQIRQRARLSVPSTARRYSVGDQLVLTKKPVKTTAGVTVRWKAAAGSQDNCTVRTRKGVVTATLVKPARCRVLAWAPAPSPEHLQYRKTFTYRFGW